MTASLLYGVLCVGGIIALALCSYGLTRWALRSKVTEDTRDLAGSVLFRIASLHGLVLALVFAQDLSGIRDVAVSASREATLVADIYYDATRFDAETTANLRSELAQYAMIVVEEEWPLLAEERHMAPRAWEKWDLAYQEVLNLTPTTPRQERLLAFMLADVRELSALRDERENVAQSPALPLFLWAALVGVILIGAAYFTWPATALNIALISGFGAFTGLIVYMIVAFSNPFAAPGRATTVGFDRFLTPEVRAMAEYPSG
ncbi:bestrophin-like domain [Pseudoroseicyclus sp. H15]